MQSGVPLPRKSTRSWAISPPTRLPRPGARGCVPPGGRPAAGWSVQRAALEAILRRSGFARRDELRVTGRPTGGAVRGEYRTGPPRKKRPYQTWLEGIEPLRASCGCPDFQRASLGLCKHVLVVLEDLASKPRRWKKLAGEEPPASRGPRLEWDPVRPLHGEGDWLERLRLHPPADGRGQRSEAWRALRRHFEAGADAALVPRVPARGDVKERLSIVEAIERFARARARSGALGRARRAGAPRAAGGREGGPRAPRAPARRATRPAARALEARAAALLLPGGGRVKRRARLAAYARGR